MDRLGLLLLFELEKDQKKKKKIIINKSHFVEPPPRKIKATRHTERERNHLIIKKLKLLIVIPVT